MVNVYNYMVSYSYRTKCYYDNIIIADHEPCFGWIHLNLTVIVTSEQNHLYHVCTKHYFCIIILLQISA